MVQQTRRTIAKTDNPVQGRTSPFRSLSDQTGITEPPSDSLGYGPKPNFGTDGLALDPRIEFRSQRASERLVAELRVQRRLAVTLPTKH